MAVKQVTIPDVGLVHLYKRRGVKSMKLSITNKGNVRVTLPMWAPYRLGVEFAKSKRDWISEKAIVRPLISHGSIIGKARHIVFEQYSQPKITTRLVGTGIFIRLPMHIAWDSKPAQDAAEIACVRALCKEGEQLLFPRMQLIAGEHGFRYSSIKMKQLRSRWGSCSDHGDIVLNCYLLQLPWELIDYVILHELTHTRVMAHGAPFWSELSKHLPNAKALRKEIKSYQPILKPNVRELAESTSLKSPLKIDIHVS